MSTTSRTAYITTRPLTMTSVHPPQANLPQFEPGPVPGTKNSADSGRAQEQLPHTDAEDIAKLKAEHKKLFLATYSAENFREEYFKAKNDPDAAAVGLGVDGLDNNIDARVERLRAYAEWRKELEPSRQNDAALGE